MKEIEDRTEKEKQKMQKLKKRKSKRKRKTWRRKTKSRNEVQYFVILPLQAIRILWGGGGEDRQPCFRIRKG
jgi:hypothetical protein